MAALLIYTTVPEEAGYIQGLSPDEISQRLY